MHRSAETHYTDRNGAVKEMDYGAETFGRIIEFYDRAFNVPLNPYFRYNVVHEFRHAFDHRVKTLSTVNPIIS